MPDISKCSNYNCKRRGSCYRYLAKPNDFHQAFASFAEGDGKNCQYHWDTSGWPSKNLMTLADSDTLNKRNQ